MNAVLFGVGAGLVFGILDVLLMIPLRNSSSPWWGLPVPGWVTGVLVGLLVSLPDAIITKSYLPILVVGVIGGAAIGWAAGRWVG